MKHARTSFYANVAHAPFLENRTRFNREMREFAETVREGKQVTASA